ncbi:MAG: Wzz/FepE/Etk N-terminal domain-containing protein, partial [Thermodesulfobacteriota bacterium]
MAEEKTTRSTTEAIDLADFVAVIFRWKVFVLSVPLLFGVLALAASSMMTEKYQVTSILEIGQVMSELEIGEFVSKQQYDHVESA